MRDLVHGMFLHGPFLSDSRNYIIIVIIMNETILWVDDSYFIKPTTLIF